jgi:CheY-like chemotaxis protein
MTASGSLPAEALSSAVMGTTAQESMPRILVVDDEPLIAMMVEEWLSELKCHTVGPAHSVTNALALIRSDQVDAAILDVSLGSEKFYPIADALSANRIPFALATGRLSADVEQRFKDVPVLMKPYDFDSMRFVVNKLINGEARS